MISSVCPQALDDCLFIVSFSSSDVGAVISSLLSILPSICLVLGGRCGLDECMTTHVAPGHSQVVSLNYIGQHLL